MDWIDEFVAGLHHTTTVLSVGTVRVGTREERFPAILVQNLYGQRIVWGPFGAEYNKRTGEFKRWTGRTVNDCNTENVVYEASDRL